MNSSEENLEQLISDSDEEPSYAVTMVFSSWSLKAILEYLEDHLGADLEKDVGFYRIDRFQGKETNRTIILMSRQLYNIALEYGLNVQRKEDFKIVEYRLRDNNKPREGYSNNLYIPLPTNISSNEATCQIQNKINICVRFGMLGSDQATLKIPFKSRESEEHRGSAYITFAQSFQNHALVRVILHDTRLILEDGTNELMKCFWARNKTTTTIKKLVPIKIAKATT